MLYGITDFVDILPENSCSHQLSGRARHVKRINGKEKKKLFQKVFSVSLAESYQSPSPPSAFLVTSKSPLPKAPASQLQFLRIEPKAKRCDHIARHSSGASILTNITSLVKPVCTPCLGSSTPPNPRSRFQNRIRNGKRTVVKNQSVPEQRVLNQQN